MSDTNEGAPQPPVTPWRPLGAPRARSGVVAAVLSFVFPGLGQAYLRHRRMALVFALPVILLLIGLAIEFGAAHGVFKVLDPTVAFALAVIVVLMGLWWAAAVVTAWRIGAHLRSAASLLVPIALVLVIASATVYGGDWMLRLSIADRALYNSSQDPTLDASLNPYLNMTPGPTEVALASGAAPTDPNTTPGATPTRPPDWIDPEDIPSDDPPPSILPGPTPAFDITQVDATDDGWLNVLLTGLDWLPGRTSARTDTMIVVSVNSATGDVYMFSFPRDTAQFPVYNGGLYNGKLNTFAGHSKDDPVKFPEPGQPALAYEIGYLLGIPIDYYASINMLGFMSLVDQVGSITVCNERQISDDHMQFYLSPGLHTLDSADALRFVRSRHGSSDFARARRQQQALTALRAEILKPQNLARLPDIVQALSGVINTNFPPNQVDQLIGLANQVSATPTAQYVFGFPEWAQHLPRIDTNGRSVQFLRLDKLAALSLQIFGDKSLYNDGGPVPSLLPTQLPTPSAAPSDGGTVC